MAQTPRNPMAMGELGRCLTKLAKQKPATPKEIERWALRVHGLEVDDETIRRAHRGDVDPTKCSIDVLVSLTSFYGVPPSALGRFTEIRLTPILSAIASDEGPGDGPEQGIASTRCRVLAIAS